MNADGIYEFIEYAEGLKCEVRHSWLSNGVQENVASHAWRMMLMAMLVVPNVDKQYDMTKVLKMITIHDLVEIESGDVPAHRHMNDRNVADVKSRDEESSMQILVGRLGADESKEILDLWREMEDASSKEARLVKFIDKLEARIQYGQMPSDVVSSELASEEFDKEFIEKYTEKMAKLCDGDELLLALNDIAHKKRVDLTS